MPEERDPRIVSLLRWLTPNPKLPDTMVNIATMCQVLSIQVAGLVSDSPELEAGLRKLLEAKDCFIRAAFEAE